MNKLPISVCVISGAEEHRIGTCLRSAAQWTSEIIVVLNQEVQDGTEAIVKSFGGKVVRHPWQGFRELGVWSKQGAALLCIEPWHGFASPIDFDGEFIDKPGLMQIAPARQRILTYRIRVG